MRSIDPKIYDKNYYLTVCPGSQEFKESGGKKLFPRLKTLLRQITINKSTRILDVGCGRGDIALYLGKNAKEAIGVDYSREAIKLANSAKKNFSLSIQKKVNFKVMNVKTLFFPDNYFDVVICIDVLEHLYKKEAEIAMQEIKRVLKKDGILFLQTGINKLLYDFVYKYYIFPVNKIVTKIDQFVRRINYKSLPKDPRTTDEKEQHVNEPTYFYLKNLLKKFGFKGEIKTEIGYIKPVKSIKTIIYNFLIAFYPLSSIYPLSVIFAWIFVCNLKNNK
ncbi:MAG: class I SAM-dependent methyltransferase [Candidatus Parcubacteria bacterium]|nr:class I SAM-dependent methyltransferase [Candidatus Parcubacteria bacterium]